MKYEKNKKIKFALINVELNGQQKKKIKIKELVNLKKNLLKNMVWIAYLK